MIQKQMQNNFDKIKQFRERLESQQRIANGTSIKQKGKDDYAQNHWQDSNGCSDRLSENY